MEEISDERIQQMFDVNVYGIIRMIRAVAPHMRKQKSGRIINIGSIAGKIVLPCNGAYSASKFALEALSDALRLELSAFNISVVLIQPGNIRTNFKNTAQKNSEEVLLGPDSVYFELYKHYIKVNSKLRDNEPGPETVVRVVKKAIEASKPRARYRAAVPTINYLLTFFGDRIKDFTFRTLFKIN